MSTVSAQTCVEDFIKYSDTVAVAAAVYHLFITNSTLGHFVGTEHRLTGANPQDLLTPDITTLYANNSKAVILELKYSLSSNLQSVKDELLKLAKYANAKRGWGVRESVGEADFALICHIADVKLAVQAAHEILAETSNPFYDPEHFSIWTWTLTVSKGVVGKEEMRLQWAYGTTRNDALQKSISQPGGILVDDQVLTMLRFQYAFIRQKPPLQYTMTLLIQNVFSALPPPSAGGKARYQLDLNTVYQRTNILFPPWWETEQDTVQVKRQWIKEALDALVELELIEKVPQKPETYSIPIPTLVTKKHLPSVICDKLVALARKKIRRVGRPQKIRGVPKKRPIGVKALTEFFDKGG